jgi:WD40 repeat protein
VLVPQLALDEVPTGAVYAPDGRVFATFGWGNGVRIWDGDTAQLRAVLEGAASKVTAVAFHPSGGRLVSGHEDGAVLVWDLATARSRVLLPSAGAVGRLGFSPSGAHLAIERKSTIAIVTESGAPVAEIAIGIEDFAWSHDGKRLLTWERSAFAPKTVSAWDAASGKRLWSRTGATGPHGGSAAWRPDDAEIAWIPDGRDIELLDAATGARRQTLRGEPKLDRVAWVGDGPAYRALGFTASGDVIVWEAGGARRLLALKSGTYHGISVTRDRARAILRVVRRGIEVLDLATGGPPRPVRLPFDDVWMLAPHPDGRRVAVVPHHTARTPAVIELDTDRAQIGTSEILDVQQIAWSPDGSRIASIQSLAFRGWDDRVRLWDARTGRITGALEPPSRKTPHSSIYTHVAWSPAGDMLAVTNMERVDLYRASGRFERTAEAHPRFQTEHPIAFSADGRRLAVGGGDKTTVRIYDPHLGIVAEHESRAGRPWSLGWSPDRKRLAIGGSGQIAVIDAETGAEVGLFKGDFGLVEAIAWQSPRVLFTANQSGSVGRIELDGAVRTFAAHKARVRALAFSADGQILATGAEDRTLKLWDTATMKPLGSHAHGDRSVTSIAWHPRAQVVAAARGSIELLRPADGASVFLHPLAARTDRETPAGLALSPGGYFGGDERALFYVRWLDRDALRAGPVRWYDTVLPYHRPSLGDELFRGCPLPRVAR